MTERNVDCVFGVEIFAGMIGLGLGVLMAPIHLCLQLQSRDSRVDWREVLVFSLAITGATTFVVALGGIATGSGHHVLVEAAAMLVMFPFIAAGSFLGRFAGWMLQRMRDHL